MSHRRCPDHGDVTSSWYRPGARSGGGRDGRDGRAARCAAGSGGGRRASAAVITSAGSDAAAAAKLTAGRPESGWVNAEACGPCSVHVTTCTCTAWAAARPPSGRRSPGRRMGRRDRTAGRGVPGGRTGRHQPGRHAPAARRRAVAPARPMAPDDASHPGWGTTCGPSFPAARRSPWPNPGRPWRWSARGDLPLRYARLRRSIQETFGAQIRMTPLPGLLSEALRLVDELAR